MNFQEELLGRNRQDQATLLAGCFFCRYTLFVGGIDIYRYMKVAEYVVDNWRNVFPVQSAHTGRKSRQRKTLEVLLDDEFLQLVQRMIDVRQRRPSGMLTVRAGCFLRQEVRNMHGLTVRTHSLP